MTPSHAKPCNEVRERLEKAAEQLEAGAGLYPRGLTQNRYLEHAQFLRELRDQLGTGGGDEDRLRVERGAAQARPAELLRAIDKHRDTLDTAAIGGPRARDEVDNALYAVADRIRCESPLSVTQPNPPATPEAARIIEEAERWAAQPRCRECETELGEDHSPDCPAATGIVLESECATRPATPVQGRDDLQRKLLNLAREQREKADAGGIPNHIEAARAAQSAYETAADLVDGAISVQGSQGLEQVRDLADRRRGELNEASRKMGRSNPAYGDCVAEARAFGVIATYAGELLDAQPESPQVEGPRCGGTGEIRNPGASAFDPRCPCPGCIDCQPPEEQGETISDVLLEQANVLALEGEGEADSTEFYSDQDDVEVRRYQPAPGGEDR